MLLREYMIVIISSENLRKAKMKRLISCEFNLDTACVELKFADGSMIAIDTIAVENDVRCHKDRRRHD